MRGPYTSVVLKILRMTTVLVAALSVLATLPVLPATLTAETGTLPTEAVPAKVKYPTSERTPE